MFEEAMMTREETVAECKRLTKAIRQTKSEKLKRDYGSITSFGWHEGF